MAQTLKKFEQKTLIKWCLLVIIDTIFFFIPESDIYTRDLKIFLVITITAILIIAFELLDTMVPAVLMPTAYFLSGIAPREVAFGGWTQITAWMILGAFLLANVLNECGILQRIAYFCIKTLGGSFNGVLYGLYVAGCVLAVVSVNSAYAIVVTLSYSICLALKLPAKSKGAAVVMMVGASAALTPGVFSYRPAWAGIIQTAAQTVDPDFVVLWQHFPLYNWPCIVFGLLNIFILTKVFKTAELGITNTKEYFVTEYNKFGKMSLSEKKALFLVGFLICYVIAYPLHGLNPQYPFMVIPWLAFLPGINIATSESIKKLNIGTIFFVVAMLSIATVGAHVGVADLISYTLTPIARQVGQVGLLALIMVIGIFANLILTPAAMIASIVPILIQISADMGMSPWAGVMTLVYTTDMYFLPHEVSALLLLFAFGMVSMKDFIKMASLKTLVFFIGYCLIQIPWYIFLGLVAI